MLGEVFFGFNDIFFRPVGWFLQTSLLKAWIEHIRRDIGLNERNAKAMILLMVDVDWIWKGRVEGYTNYQKN